MTVGAHFPYSGFELGIWWPSPPKGFKDMAPYISKRMSGKNIIYSNNNIMSNRNELVRRLLAVITMSERQNLVNIGEEARPIPVPRRRGEKHALFWGARGGAVVRALASHQCGPVSNPGVDSIGGLSLLLVFSLAPRGFPLSKTNIFKFQFDQESVRRRTTMWKCYLHIFIYLFIYSWSKKKDSNSYTKEKYPTIHTVF